MHRNINQSWNFDLSLTNVLSTTLMTTWGSVNKCFVEQTEFHLSWLFYFCDDSILSDSSEKWHKDIFSVWLTLSRSFRSAILLLTSSCARSSFSCSRRMLASCKRRFSRWIEAKSGGRIIKENRKHNKLKNTVQNRRTCIEEKKGKERPVSSTVVSECVSIFFCLCRFYSNATIDSRTCKSELCSGENVMINRTWPDL